MLNYLNHSPNGGALFLDVDPRHILGVQQEHGAYFEKIIFKCGLTTKNVVISTAINSSYALNHKELLDGLYNYRRRGYQIALNIGSLYTATGLWDLIAKMSADYLRINALNIGTNQHSNAIWLPDLKKLIELQNLAGGQTILQQVEQKEQADIAASAGFDLVQGDYYEKLVEKSLEN
jgi:EAL domain-containing protein (putative c-di-GMP-specific phosphodiesterase class I)